MPVNRRTVTLIVVVVAVIAGVYAITWWQRARETQRLLQDLRAQDHAIATEAIEGLRDRGPAIRGELLDMLVQGDDRTRWRAAELLAFAGGARARAALTSALDDPYADVRMNAALSLARLKARDAAGRIALLATDPDEELAVRIAAVNALRMLRAEGQLDALIELVEARPAPPPPEGEELAEPAEGAAAVEAPEPPPDETWLLRAAAVRAVAIVGASARELAAPVEAETPPTEQAEALPGLEPAGPASRIAQLLDDSIDPLLEPNANVRRAACYALGDLVALQPDEAVMARGVDVLVAALQDESSEVRIAAAHTLNIIDVPASRLQTVEDALAEALNDDHYWVRQAAMEATEGG